MLTWALLLSQTKPFTTNAQFKKPYLTGYEVTVSGSREKLDTGSQRVFTLNSVQTAQAFGGKKTTWVAAPNRKLILLNVTIKNPNKFPLSIAPSDTVHFVLYEKELAKSIEYLSAVEVDGSHLEKKLSIGQSVDTTIILSAPETMPHLHLGITWARQHGSPIWWFDIVPNATKSTSIFSTDGFNLSSIAKVKPAQTFDFDTITLNVGKPITKGDHIAVPVKVTNRMPTAQTWGWQYASAQLTMSTGDRVSFYPTTYLAASGEGFAGEIPAGQSKDLEYRFYPPSSGTSKSLEFKSPSSQRSVVVSFQDE